MSRYKVTATWSGEWWVLQAVEAPGAISQVASLDQAGEIVEAIAFVTGEPAEDIEFELLPRVYEVTATHDDGYWQVSVPTIDRVTQARTVDEIEPMAKELIEIMTGDDDPELTIAVRSETKP